MKGSGQSRSSKPDCLVLFTRYPTPGTTKTRLIPALGAQGAATLQKNLTEKIVAECLKLPPQKTHLLIHYSGGDEESMAEWLGRHFYSRQPASDLGARMAHGLQHAAATGAGHLLLIGSDIPELTATILGQAFRALHRGETVLGPSLDGGFYAIGMPRKLTERLLPELFESIAWSTTKVCEIIRNRLAEHGYPPLLLPTLMDIDTPEDLAHCRQKDLLQ